MLAAMPADDARILDMFRLALSIVSHGKSAPDQLRAYFESVLNQARALRENPGSVSGPLMPEAIQLAIELDALDEFRVAIDDITELNSITPDQANNILGSMERHFAA